MPGPSTARTPSLDTRARILDATLRLAESTGLRKLSMEEVARRGRVGRATIYVYFAGRDALIQALVEQELSRFFVSVASAIDPIDDFEEKLVTGVAVAYRWLRHHKALQAILQINPQVLQSYVITENSTALDLAREFVESQMRDENIPQPLQPQFAEHIARTIHSLILVPGGAVDIDAPDGPEIYVRNFLVPVLHSLATASHADKAPPSRR